MKALPLLPSLLTRFGLIYSSTYLENLLPEIFSVCLQASFILSITSWSLRREKKRKQNGDGRGNMRNFIPILNLTCIFQKGRNKVGKGCLEKEKSPSHGHRVPVQSAKGLKKSECALSPPKSFLKFNPQLSKICL